ncbi:hypothetical protein LH464_21480 [Neorhizobium sp. T786]|uniref:hypothetical protein n=1 Tax=Pseudorhizobium xiangyangii TaxID=2883104 RepID=UPI001D00187A|nr:hypothetical protein [Neorhizobium xiangyangii]MCB5205041.1 hypothetical protein [Neorhizobium xiangyangii]
MKPENFQAGLSGKHRELPRVQAIRYPYRWEDSGIKRVQQFKDWRHIAMQVLQRSKGSFRVVAIMDEAFDFETCECLKTDEEIALEAGNCTVKTIQRDLRALRQAGLILSETHWINKGGKKVKGRRVRLAVPSDLTGINVR